MSSPSSNHPINFYITFHLAPNIYTENEPIAKYEIMDGAPVRGESIPIRLFLAGYDLTPTMRDINKKFSVRYYLNLVLVDEEERRYFKQQVCMYTGFYTLVYAILETFTLLLITL